MSDDNFATETTEERMSVIAAGMSASHEHACEARS
jgi:hypothetical protein